MPYYTGLVCFFAVRADRLRRKEGADLELSSDKQEIMSELARLAKYYAPSLEIREGTAYAALCELFCVLTAENRALFSQLEERHRLLYLNMYGLKKLPALPAAGYVKVTATNSGVTLKKGTRLGCDNDAEFITEQELCVTDAELRAMFCTADDYICRCPENRLFDYGGKNLQETAVYFSAGEILQSVGSFSRAVKLFDTGKRNQRGISPPAELSPSLLRWEYLDGSGAVPVSSVEYKDGTFELNFSDAIPAVSFCGITGRWIKITFTGGQYLDFVSLGTVEITMSVDGAKPQSVYFNDAMLSDEDFLPFGEQPAEYDAFYVGSGDCFGKKKSRVTIKAEYSFSEYPVFVQTDNEIQWKSVIPASKFVPKPPLKKKIDTVVWEYWNGRGWHRIFRDDSHSGTFSDTEKTSLSISFDCPDDMSETFVGADYGFFVRCRVSRLTPGYGADMAYVVPRVSRVLLSCSYGGAARGVDHVFAERSLALREADTAGFFLADDERHGGYYTYFCFDRPLPVGYTNIYFRLRPSDFRAGKIEWEALCAHNGGKVWKSVFVGDKTFSLSESGIITFGITSPMADSELFSQNGYWLRACVADKPAPAALDGIYLNTVPVIQVEKMPEMYFTVPPYERAPEFALAEGGVFEAVVKVLRNGEWTALSNDCYSVDADEGLIRFDMDYEPPFGEEPTVCAEYSVTKGAAGNVPQGGIDRLLDPIPFVDEITNPESTFGGRDAETFKECAERGKSRTGTLGRCVSASDCEEAAKYADNTVVRAKALSSGGKVTLVLLTKSADTNAFKHTRKNVADAVGAVMPFYLRGGLEIKQADYIEISVVVYLASDGEAFPQTIHTEVTEKLRKFLDPLSGGASGCGYEIGEYPKPENVRALIMSVPHVTAVTDLQLMCRRGTSVFDYEEISEYEYGVPTFGEPVISISGSPK